MMPRRPAHITQADVARAIRAAKQTGAGAVEVLPNGTIRVTLLPSLTETTKAEPAEDTREIVL
jgi:DNA-binding XRE family transcriptional regulator